MDHSWNDRWTSVRDYWPQRLLYIPTLESVPRSGNNEYRAEKISVRSPHYSILSYTWGRWKIRDRKGCPALLITGTPWDIPAVDEHHFTVEMFRNVLQNIYNYTGVEWIWVDVGCLDQRDNKDAAIEIGRQASIFKGAQHSFVWLCRLNKSRLFEVVRNINDAGVDFSDFVHKPSRRDEIDLQATLLKLKNALDAIFNDPWFSSLWTLQEAVLRSDSTALSAEGETVVWDEDYPMHIAMLINCCKNIYHDSEVFVKDSALAEPFGEQVVEICLCIKKRILHTGFYFVFSNNPNVQYGMAQYRRTSRPVDRVYAIMQIYNLRVGKAARPGENPGLEELKDEFASAILRKGAIEGQSFIHTKAPQPGKSWRITEDSIIPEPLIYFSGQSSCTICPKSADSVDRVTATGRIYILEDLIRVASYEIGLFLDYHVFESFETNVPYRMIGLNDPLITVVYFNSHFNPKNIRVLFLGKVGRKSLGLLLRRIDEAGGGDDWRDGSYERQGLCLWDEFESPPAPWHSVDHLQLQ